MNHVIEILEEAASWEAAAYVAGHGPVMDVADIRDILDYNHWVLGEARTRYEKGMTHEEAADDLLDHLGKHRARRNPQGLYSSVKMMFAEFADKPNHHLRKNYPKYLAESYRLSQEFPKRHPDLVKETARTAAH
jgi:hypothetical protein